jgi:outer membrane protein OmpA-like peptidoglycan-associated protein
VPAFRARHGHRIPLPDMRRLRRGRGAVFGAGLLCAAAAVTTLGLATATAPARATLRPAAVAASVPILGQLALKSTTETGGASAVGTLHGVRRIPGGTVIYYSLGFPSGTQGDAFVTALEDRTPARARSNANVFFSRNMLVDTVGKKVYSGLIPSGKIAVVGGKSACICSDSASGHLEHKVGQASVFYQVIAPLPDSVSFVDVFISGQVIGHVKVDNGPMTPEVDSSKTILVGMGWPKIDQTAVTTSAEPAKSVIDLKTSVADLEGTVTTRANSKQVSVELASDVLFATDSATLSPKAQAVLSRAAADVKAAGGTGTLQVIGYTDDTGTALHNVDLSRRRAASVAAAIKPLLPVGVTLPTSGKGEADPVALNETPEGRALNRRVSIVLATKGGAK